MSMTRREFYKLALGSAVGLPPAGAMSSVEDFDYQITYQRAFEAVL